MDNEKAKSAPLNCKHGQLARNCEICSLEQDSELLHKSNIIEIAVRNPGVMEYIKHWEERVEKVERMEQLLSKQLSKSEAKRTLLLAYLGQVINLVRPLIGEKMGRIIDQWGEEYNAALKEINKEEP